MSLRLKIMLSFLVMALFMTTQAVIGFRQNDHSRSLVDQAIHKNYRVVQDLNSLSSGLQQLRRYEKEYFIYIPDVGKKQKYVNEWRDALGKSELQLKSMKENSEGRYGEEDIAKLKEWEGAVAFYAAEFEKIVARFAKHDPAAMTGSGPSNHPSVEANDLIQEGKARMALVFTGTEKMIRAKTEAAISSALMIENNFKEMEWIYIALTGAAILISVVLLLVVYRSLVSSLNTLLRESQRVYHGNLSAPVEIIHVPEFRTLASALEQMRIERLAVEQRKSARTV